jgi:hypothetical protein
MATADGVPPQPALPDHVPLATVHRVEEVTTITKMVLLFADGRNQDLRLTSVAEEGGDSSWYIRDYIVFPVEQVSNFGVGFDLGVDILDEVGGKVERRRRYLRLR